MMKNNENVKVKKLRGHMEYGNYSYLFHEVAGTFHRLESVALHLAVVVCVVHYNSHENR